MQAGQQDQVNMRRDLTRRFTASLVEAFAPMVNLVYPPRCPLCGDGIAAQSGVCSGCWSELVIPGLPACSTCQRPFRADDGVAGIEDSKLCAPCMADPPLHDGIAAGTLYNDASRKLILSFKHGGRIALAPILAKLIAARLPEMGDDWSLIPVPLHRWRLWRRGYNQAAMLAVEIGKSTGTKVLRDGLLRTKQTRSLGGLGRKARKRTLAGALSINPRHEKTVKGRNIILVDDVLTSGATSEACVRVLKRHGAKTVVVACFARVLDEALGVSRDAKPPNKTPEV